MGLILEFIAWLPLVLVGIVFLLGIAATVRQRIRNGAIRRELASLTPDAGRDVVTQRMEPTFRAAFTDRKKKVSLPDQSGYHGYTELIDSIAARYHYERAVSKGKSGNYEISLPAVPALESDRSVAVARARVRENYGVDPFDEGERERHLAEAARRQRIINWFTGLILMPAVVCFAITLVALGGGRSHDPGEERIVDSAPVFVLTTGILTVVLAVAATIFIVPHYRRMKHHKTMADGPREALAWQILEAST